MDTCNWTGDPNERSLGHITQCAVCMGRWPQVADAMYSPTDEERIELLALLRSIREQREGGPDADNPA